MIMRDHEYYMRQALELAEAAWGLTSPNPMVGAVVVDEAGNVVGRGYHHGAGLPHAEPNALRDAGENARGATLYVTLEPCCTWGRTPPCTEAVIAAGIRQVVIGCVDTNPKHAGHGIDVLKSHGITVVTGVLEEECRRLNDAFFKWIGTGRPFVMLKMAMTLDGKIATQSGQSQWITGESARAWVQRFRCWADAVMVGGETVRKDNPSLTVRSPLDWPRQPLRFVWTSRPLPPSAKMLSDGGPVPECVKPQTAAEWDEFLAGLGRRQVTALLLEGGGELAGNALQAGIVDRVAFFVAPKILCGRGSRSVTGGENPESLGEALRLENVQTQFFGNDLLYLADVTGTQWRE